MKRGKITIDLDVWTTPKKAAPTWGLGTGAAITNRIRKGEMKAWKIPELGLTLVKKGKITTIKKFNDEEQHPW